MSDESKKYFVYIIRTQNNKLYIGYTNDLNRRELGHKYFHHGAKFLHYVGSKFNMVYTEKFLVRAEAMKREKQLKGWTRAKKEALIAGNLGLIYDIIKLGFNIRQEDNSTNI